MKTLGFIVIILITLSAVGFARGQKPQLPVSEPAPADFSYPIDVATLEDDRPIRVRTLSGRVARPYGAGLDRVLVERMSTGWKERLEAVFTDANGWFRFPGEAKGRFYLRLNRPGYTPTMFIFDVTPKAKKRINVELSLAN